MRKRVTLYRYINRHQTSLSLIQSYHCIISRFYELTVAHPMLQEKIVNIKAYNIISTHRFRREDQTKEGKRRTTRISSSNVMRVAESDHSIRFCPRIRNCRSFTQQYVQDTMMMIKSIRRSFTIFVLRYSKRQLRERSVPAATVATLE